jgi:hypothetical protein
MDDFGLYIKKEITNLIKRAQSSSRTLNLKEKPKIKQVLPTKTFNKPFWY